MWKLRQIWQIVKIRCRQIRPPSAEDRAIIRKFEPIGLAAARRARAQLADVDRKKEREGKS